MPEKNNNARYVQATYHTKAGSGTGIIADSANNGFHVVDIIVDPTATQKQYNLNHDETNKLLKGKSLGSVTIRPIVTQELLTSPTKTYSKEGQVYVKAKGDKAKAVYVYVPKKGKYSDSKKVKKIKLKKGTYTYDSSTPTVIFNSDLISGSAVAGR